MVHTRWAAAEHVHRYLDGEVLLGLYHMAILVEIIDEHAAAGALLLQQAAVAHKGGEVGAGGVVAYVHEGGVQRFPLAVYLAVDLGRTEHFLFLQALGQRGELILREI